MFIKKINFFISIINYLPSTTISYRLTYTEYLLSRAAFFEGQIEQPVRGLIALLTHQDIPVLVAINAKGLYVIDDIHCVSMSFYNLQYNFLKFQTVLLTLRFEEFNWEYAKPSNGNVTSLPCLFILFMVVENGARVSKILQIFSKQARLMDTLISYFMTQLKTKTREDIMKPLDNQITNDHGTL